MVTEVDVNSGSFTPESLRLRRRLAEAMMKTGFDTSPVQHWSQGAARMVQALMGGYQLGEMEKREKSERDSANAFVAGRYGVTPPATDAPAQSPSGGGRQTPAALNFESQGEDPLIPFLRQQEGFRPSAYDDFQQRSIGYGTRANPGETSITREEAERRLEHEVRNARRLVRERFPNLTPGQETALTDLTFNTGTEWMGSGLGQSVAQGNWPRAQQLFSQYVNAGGQPRSHLAARRLSMVGHLSPGEAPAAAAAPAPQSVPGITVTDTRTPLAGPGTVNPAAPAPSAPSPSPTPAPAAAAPARMTREQATQEAWRRLGARGEIIRRALTSTVPGVQRAAQAEIEQAISAVMAEQPPAGALDQAKLANEQAQARENQLQAESLQRGANRANPENVQQRAGSILERLSQAPQEFGTTAFERALGPLSGASTNEGQQGYVQAIAQVIPTAAARLFGHVRYMGEGGAVPTDVRNRVEGDTQALVTLLRPMLRIAGEGSQSNMELQQLINSVGNLSTSSSVAEYNRRLEEVRQRLNSALGLNINAPGPQSPSPNAPPTAEQDVTWVEGLNRWAADRDPTGLTGMAGRAAGSPMAPPAEAAAPAAPVAQASPEQRSMIPPRPSSVPAGSMYNPARRQWRDPTGRIYDETGQPVGAQ